MARTRVRNGGQASNVGESCPVLPGQTRLFESDESSRHVDTHSTGAGTAASVTGDRTTGFREVLVRCLDILNAVECQVVGAKIMDVKDIVADIKSARDFIHRVWKVYV